MAEADLAGDRALQYDVESFPDAVPVGGQPIAVSYAYAPGEEWDGVTIQLPAENFTGGASGSKLTPAGSRPSFTASSWWGLMMAVMSFMP